MQRYGVSTPAIDTVYKHFMLMFERDDAERSDAPALLGRGVSRGRCINLFVRPTVAFNKPPLSLSIERASESVLAARDNRRRLVGRFHQMLKTFQHFSRIAFYCHCIV